MYVIRMGVPEMERLWKELSRRWSKDDLKKNEVAFFKKWVKAMDHLRNNPRHPGLRTHEIEPLSKRYGKKVWQSYLENRKNPGRMFWIYGPGREEITVLAIEPHPEDKKRGAYDRIKLDDLPLYEN